MATVLAKSITIREKDVVTDSSSDDKKGASTSVVSIPSIPPLGAPNEEKRFWFQRGKDYNPDAIATQVRCSSASASR